MRFWKIDNFLDHEFPPQRYIIDPIFPLGGVLLLHGQQTSGKSQLALGMVRAIAEGGLFLRQYETNQRKVLYIQFDMPEVLFQDRTLALGKHLRGMPLGMLTHYGYHNVDKWVKYPPDAIKEAQAFDPEVVMVDSMRRCHGLDENDSRTVRVVYEAWQEMFPGSSFVMIHHESKDQPGAAWQRSAASKPRGSSAWIDDADAAIGIERLGRGKGGQHKAKLTFTKCYTAEEPTPIEVLMDPDLLTLEPGSLTTRQYGEMFFHDNPEATRHQLANYLQGLTNEKGECVCGQSNAYKIASNVLQSIKFHSIPQGGGMDEGVPPQSGIVIP